MIISEKTLEIRGVFREEIIECFMGIGREFSQEGRFVGESWDVEIGEEKVVTLGSLKLPSVMVIFRGAVEILDRRISAFRLRFLKAGG